MTELHDENPNPYQSPATETGVALLAPQGEVDLVMLKNFRKQIHSLGAVWLLIGGLIIAIGVWILVESGEGMLLATPFFTGGLLWVAVGAFTLLKHVWAVYVGLVLSYLALAGSVLGLAPCQVILLLLVVIQAHRVLRWAKKLWSCGVPLTATVEQLLSVSRPRTDA